MKKKSKEQQHKEDSQQVCNQQEISEEQDQVETLRKEKEELFDKLQRVSADYVNYQKRSTRQISESVSYEKERIIKSILPVLDNFEHTMNNAESTEDIGAIIKGVKIIYDQMLDILKSHGIEVVTAKDQKFDPAMHEAMMQQYEPEKEDNVVLQEFQRGYKLNGRVIRPSKVIVNKIPAQTNAESPADISDENEIPDDF